MNGTPPPYSGTTSHPSAPHAAHLQTWENAHTHPIYTAPAEDALTTQLLLHLYQRHPITIIYHGGSQPGEARTILPLLLIRKSRYDTNYLIAHCQKRQQPRTFNLDKIELTQPPLPL